MSSLVETLLKKYVSKKQSENLALNHERTIVTFSKYVIFLLFCARTILKKKICLDWFII